MSTTIEDDVRAMLARRAADVADDGAAGAPPLPTGLRIPLDDRARSVGTRTRWLAAAAAIVLVLGVAGLVVRNGDPAERTDTTDQTTGTAPPRPGHLTFLPLGVDPTIGPVRGLGRPAPTPEEASDVLMAEAFGDDVAPNGPFEWPGGDPDQVWAAYRIPLVDLDPRAWGGDGANDVVGTVTARQTDAGWYVVAVSNAALDLRGVRHDGRRLSGVVRSTSSAPLRIIVSTVLGEELAKSDLTTSEASGRGPSVLPLDDIDVDLGDQPVVIRVEAGDRPGQVGIDGVRVAALSTVVLPAPTDASAVPTTAPAEDGGPVTGLPQGLGVEDLVPLWDAPPQGRDRGPWDVAEGYLVDRFAGIEGLAFGSGVVATDDPDVSLVEWTRADIDDPRAAGTIAMRHDPSGWVVVAALHADIDLAGVTITDGWTTGGVTSSSSGEWAVALAPRPGSLAPGQWQDLLGYVSTLDAGQAVFSGTSEAPGPVPAERPDGPVTLLAAGPERAGVTPFAEIAFGP